MLPKGYLIGNLSAEPILKTTNNSNNYCFFSVYCKEVYQKQSQTAPKYHFYNCKVWGKRAEFVTKYLKKNDQVFIEYTLTTSSYTNSEGRIIRTTDLLVDNIETIYGRNNKNTESEVGQTLFEKNNDEEQAKPFNNIHQENKDNTESEQLPEITLDDIFSNEN